MTAFAELIAATNFSFLRGASHAQEMVGQAAELGLAGSLIAVHTSYLLLIVSSPYRAMWLAELLAVPLGFGGAARLWERGTPLARGTAVGLVALLTLGWSGAFPFVLFGAMLLACLA